MWIFNSSGSRSFAEHLFDVVGAVFCAKSVMDRREGPLTRLHTDDGREVEVRFSSATRPILLLIRGGRG
jgi:hypothetical protein